MNQSPATVAIFDTPMTAEIARLRLETEGIESFLSDTETVTMAWHLGQAVGGIKLQVRHEDRSQALAILGEIRAESRLETDKEETDPDRQIAERAFRAAAFGTMFVPLQIYSLWLLARLRSRTEFANLAPGLRTRVTYALILDLWLVLHIVLLWFFIFGAP